MSGRTADEEWQRCHPKHKLVRHKISDKLNYEWRKYCHDRQESGKKDWLTVSWPSSVDREMDRLLDRKLYKDAVDKCDISCDAVEFNGNLMMMN